MNPGDFLESQGINKILHDFAVATGFAVVLTDIHGKEVSELFNPTGFCVKLRENADFHSRCIHSDRCGGLEASKENKPCIYRCHAGLIDFSIPLVINNHLVGFILAGQIRIDQMDDINNIQKVEKVWQHNKELVSLYNDIKKVTYKQIFASADLLKTLVDDSIKQELDFVVINDNFNINNLFKTSNENCSDDPKIIKAINYIEKHYFEDINLDQVADHVYLRPIYFTNLLKKDVGVAFNYYNKQTRLTSAKKMLESSDWPIARISRNLGYSCVSYFCKVFKSAYNLTPQEYRKALIFQSNMNI